MRYEDLPLALRKQADAKLGRQKRSQAGHGAIGGPCPYWCVPCGQRFDKFEGKGGAEEHARATGHVRQELVL